MRSRAAAALVSLAVALPTAGCYQGSTSTVDAQPPTGNGTDFEVGEGFLVQDATLVADGSGSASLLLTMINNGARADALASVTTEPASKSSQTSAIVVQPGTAVRVGAGTGPSAGSEQIALSKLNVPVGSYAAVTFTFRDAGSSEQQVAVVPATGYYAGLGPSASAKKPDE